MKKVVMLVLAMVLLVSTFAIADVGYLGPPIDIDDVYQMEENEYTVLVTDVPIVTDVLLKMEYKKWKFVTVVKHDNMFHWYFTRPIQLWLLNEVQPPFTPEPTPTFNLK